MPAMTSASSRRPVVRCAFGVFASNVDIGLTKENYMYKKKHDRHRRRRLSWSN